MARQVIEELVEQPRPRRQKRYGSVRSAVAAIKALIRKEDAGLSALDPEEAALRSSSPQPEHYAPQTSHHAPINALAAALRAAQRRSVRDYEEGDQVSPQELWACWGRHRVWAWTLSRVADWLEEQRDEPISKQAVKRNRIDRGDGYVESALKARHLWSERLARKERERRAGAREQRDEYEEAM